MVTTLQRTLSDRRFWIMFLLSTCILTPTIAIASRATGFAGATLYVDNTAPGVSISTPSSGDKNLAPSASLPIGWIVTEPTSESGVDTVSLTIDGNDQGVTKSDGNWKTVNPPNLPEQDQGTFNYDFSGWSDGVTYTIKVTATDNAGNSASDSVTVTTYQDVTLDVTKWINPSPGSWVSGTVDLVVKATPVAEVDTPVSFTVDGETTGLVSTETSNSIDYDGDGNAQEWKVQLDTTQLTDGSHTVKAHVYDSDGDPYVFGTIAGSENDGGIDWLPTDLTTWLVSFGIALLGSLGIAYSAEWYTLRKRGK